MVTYKSGMFDSLGPLFSVITFAVFSYSSEKSLFCISVENEVSHKASVSDNSSLSIIPQSISHTACLNHFRAS